MSGADRLLCSTVAGDWMSKREGVPDDRPYRRGHRVSAPRIKPALADERGELLWSGYRFRTNPADLEQLWSRLPEGRRGGRRDRGDGANPQRLGPVGGVVSSPRCTVVLVPRERQRICARTTRSTPRATVSIRCCWRGCRCCIQRGSTPSGASARATRCGGRRNCIPTLVKRRTTSIARLDALLEILGPDWHAAFSGELSNKTPLRFLAAGYGDPIAVRRLGRARLVKFLGRHSRGAWGEAVADMILAAAAASRELWGEDLEFADLAEDIAIEARLRIADHGRAQGAR